jgi:hypothetical protein
MDKLFQYLLIIYIFTCLVLFFKKPSWLIDDDGNLKAFGTGNNRKTVFSYSTITLFLAIIFFFIYNMIRLRRLNMY